MLINLHDLVITKTLHPSTHLVESFCRAATELVATVASSYLYHTVTGAIPWLGDLVAKKVIDSTTQKYKNDPKH